MAWMKKLSPKKFNNKSHSTKLNYEHSKCLERIKKIFKRHFYSNTANQRRSNQPIMQIHIKVEKLMMESYASKACMSIAHPFFPLAACPAQKALCNLIAQYCISELVDNLYKVNALAESSPGIS